MKVSRAGRCSSTPARKLPAVGDTAWHPGGSWDEDAEADDGAPAPDPDSAIIQVVPCTRAVIV